jgi:ribosomal protein S7
MKNRLLIAGAAHLALNVAATALLGKEAKAAAAKAADAAAVLDQSKKKRKPRAPVSGHQAPCQTGSKPVAGGGARQRERALAAMAAAAEKAGARQRARELARQEAAAAAEKGPR